MSKIIVVKSPRSLMPKVKDKAGSLTTASLDLRGPYVAFQVEDANLGAAQLALIDESAVQLVQTFDGSISNEEIIPDSGEPFVHPKEARL